MQYPPASLRPSALRRLCPPTPASLLTSCILGVAFESHLAVSLRLRSGIFSTLALSRPRSPCRLPVLLAQRKHLTVKHVWRTTPSLLNTTPHTTRCRSFVTLSGASDRGNHAPHPELPCLYPPFYLLVVWNLWQRCGEHDLCKHSAGLVYRCSWRDTL